MTRKYYLSFVLVITGIWLIGCSSPQSAAVDSPAPANTQAPPPTAEPTPTNAPPTVAAEYEAMSAEELGKALIKAAQKDDVVKITDLLAAGADVNTIDKASEFTPITIATVRNNLKTFELLKEAGADLSHIDKRNNTLLHHAAFENGTNIAEILLTENVIDLEARRSKFGFTPLLVAAFQGNVEMVELLIANGADIEAKDDWGDTPVNVAAWDGRLAVIEKLLELGAQVDVKNQGGQNALDYARSQNQPEVETFLLTLIDESSPETSEETNAEGTPDISAETLAMSQEELDKALIKATQKDDVEQINELLAAGADVNTVNKAVGFTPIVIATVRNNLETFILLQEAGADLSHIDTRNNTLLHHAAFENATDIAEILLAENLIDLEARRTQFGFTPLLVAAFEGNVEMVELLLANGSNIEAVDDWGDTAVNVSAWNGKLNVVEKLVELGAIAQVENTNGNNALDHAESQNHDEIAAFLSAAFGN
ncbi:MAG: ankyrin repeat domain-containing protein [Anaerolineae bacterium]